ncbi:RagB/SusD family nutrient uptake outer membrane protein [Mucilaginibacter pocheonensis]|uniref:Starch-binding associating with outer membrane n=1 Tax=Mucilaginibacter pocheonensis TaxID=398050 RepID=A0ABU1T7U3_9SPHI|nr:RagB/SusD family nutrient uptake outer membrane protein [Mucilaginibacter pocheonensis]MDR6941359.1 hypothetical protein [Mucilaginibacter pocheonensis]
MIKHIKQNRCRIILTTGIILQLITFASCKKFVEVDPPVNAITSTTAYASNTSAAAVMSGVYFAMMNSGSGISDGSGSLSELEGCAADELTNYLTGFPVWEPFYQNVLTSSASDPSGAFWTEIYNQIHVVNTVIEGVAKSSGITPAMKRQLDGEAKFIRAFYHFYGANIYGDIPIVTTTDYQTNNVIKRSPRAQVYQQIIQDLKDAQSELSKDFVDAGGNPTTERIRPNRGAAQALLARVYLYDADLNNNVIGFANAKAEADSVISNTTYSLLTDLNTVFLKNSGEAIWQLSPDPSSGLNTADATYFILTGPPSTVALSNNVVNAFEINDKRFSNWVGVYQQGATTTYYYPYKYKVYNYGDPISEYTMVFRLAEQYLIRAEAEANGAGQGLNAAIADMNVIRTRAGLPNYSGSIDKTAVLEAILHERQVELFTEWGHRWFDLIRTGNINSVMGSPGNVCQSKGGTWAAYKAFAPIPLSEIQVNSNLTQNLGYK